MNTDNDLEQLKAAIVEKAYKSWGGPVGEERAAKVKALLDTVLPDWAAVTGHSELEILQALEKRRDYSVTGFYQPQSMPLLSDVNMFETLADLRAAVGDDGFRCPSCGRVSGSATKCDVDDKCRWNCHGMYECLGKGFRVAIRKNFLKAPVVSEIFMPIAFENTGVPNA